MPAETFLTIVCKLKGRGGRGRGVLERIPLHPQELLIIGLNQDGA